MKRTNKGFTLIELVIVVAMIAILAAIALPSYLNQIRKSRRAQAEADLAELAQGMERSYTMTRDYTKNTAGAAYALPFAESPRDAAAGTGYYDLAISASAATSYTITATPKNQQSSDLCGTLSINSTGLKTYTGSDAQCKW